MVQIWFFVIVYLFFEKESWTCVQVVFNEGGDINASRENPWGLFVPVFFWILFSYSTLLQDSLLFRSFPWKKHHCAFVPLTSSQWKTSLARRSMRWSRAAISTNLPLPWSSWCCLRNLETLMVLQLFSFFWRMRMVLECFGAFGLPKELGFWGFWLLEGSFFMCFLGFEWPMVELATRCHQDMKQGILALVDNFEQLHGQRLSDCLLVN